MKRDLAKLAVIALALFLCLRLFSRVEETERKGETDLVRNAVKNAALTCYAVEGVYPDDLDYLREHYHLSYNEEKYHVFYEPLASNLMPSIKVAERGGKMDK